MIGKVVVVVPFVLGVLGVLGALVSAAPALAQPRYEERQQFRERVREEREARGRPLSPEERREIRRDIGRHGKDVYGDRPHGGNPYKGAPHPAKGNR